jgi:hypothetical protein
MFSSYAYLELSELKLLDLLPSESNISRDRDLMRAVMVSLATRGAKVHSRTVESREHEAKSKGRRGWTLKPI